MLKLLSIDELPPHPFPFRLMHCLYGEQFKVGANRLISSCRSIAMQRRRCSKPKPPKKPQPPGRPQLPATRSKTKPLQPHWWGTTTWVRSLKRSERSPTPTPTSQTTTRGQARQLTPAKPRLTRSPRQRLPTKCCRRSWPKSRPKSRQRLRLVQTCTGKCSSCDPHLYHIFYIQYKWYCLSVFLICFLDFHDIYYIFLKIFTEM